MIHEIIPSPRCFTTRTGELAYSVSGQGGRRDVHGGTASAIRQLRAEAAPEVFDRAHLSHYTMQNADLEREIIGLFLMQLPRPSR